jgi:hypothetical protein
MKIVTLIICVVLVSDSTIAVHAQTRQTVVNTFKNVPIPAWFDSCIRDWEADRGKSAALDVGIAREFYQQIATESTLTRATSVNQNAQIDSCPKLEVLLDHLREQAATHTVGQAHLVITGNNETRTLDGVSNRYQDKLGIFATGGNESITSVVAGNELNGTLTYSEGNHDNTAHIKLTESDNSWRGTMTPAPPKFGRHTILTLQISDEQADPLEDYLINHVLVSEEGLFWCQNTCPKTKALFEEGLNALVSWSVDMFTAQDAYLKINDPKLAGVQVFLDKREVAPLPFTLSLKPGKSYSLTLQRGLDVIYTDSVTLAPNENRQWRAPVLR